MRIVSRVACLAFLASSLPAQLVYTGNGYLVVPWPTGYGQALPAQGCTQASIPPWSLMSTQLTPCGPLGPIGVPAPDERFGDFAANRTTEELWVTDGNVFVSYSLRTSLQVPPAVLRCFTAPGWGRGLGCTAGLPGADVLWLTNGTRIRGVVPPAGPGLPFDLFGSNGFLVPSLPAGAVINDLDYDSTTGTLWLADSAGFVREIVPGGAPGPNAPFQPDSIGHGICGTTIPPGPVVGIAVETTSAAGTVLIVASGLVKRFLPSGVLAPQESHAGPCMALSSYQAGIAFAPRPIPLDTVTGASNQFGAFLGNSGGFVATHTFAPGATHVLVASLLPLCPPQPIPNTFVWLYLDPGSMVVLGNAAPPPGVPAAVPFGYPPLAGGLTLFLQWGVLDANGAIHSSDPMQLQTSR